MPDRRQTLKWLGAASLGAYGAAQAASSLPAAAASGASKNSVIVIGGGLSGLYAAMLLEQQGVKVTLLEGRDRTGGRVYTLYDLPGQPEAGGEIFGPRYARCLDVLQQLGVKQRKPQPRTQAADEDLAMRIGEDLITLDQWAGHPRNPHPEPLRSLTPWGLFMRELPKSLTFENLIDWTDPRNGRFDIPYAQTLRNMGFNDEAIRLQQANTPYGNTLHDVSTLHLMHYFTWSRLNATGPGRTQCVGGNQKLPDGMREALRGDVILNAIVHRLEDRGDGVRITTRDGRRFEGSHALLTVPFTLARFMQFDPVLRGVQWEAVETLPYYSTFQIHYEFKSRFWEADGLPPSWWTDGPLGRVNLLRDANGEPACLFIYANGLEAQFLDRMTKEEVDRFVQAELARIRPSTKGQLRALRIHSNQNDPFFAGSYAYWNPGMPLRFPRAMAAPHGRIHFAGEHTALLNRGMEGAMESGERAALEILERL